MTKGGEDGMNGPQAARDSTRDINRDINPDGAGSVAAPGAGPCVVPSSVVRLRCMAAAVGPARRRFRRDLAGAGVPHGLADDAEVIVSELLGNAVTHARPIAGGVLLLGWRVEAGELTVRVTDGGSGRGVEPREAGPMADSGRGLHIIETLASSWGVAEHAGGLRTVWAALQLPSAPRPALRIVR